LQRRLLITASDLFLSFWEHTTYLRQSLDDAVHERLAVSSFSFLVFEVLGADDGGGHDDDDDDDNNNNKKVWHTIFTLIAEIA
jgi:hypothetical protein